MKDNNQLKMFTAPKGLNAVKSSVFFAIAFVAGNIIFTISALMLDFLSDTWRLVSSLIISITMIVYIYIEHYHNFTYGNKSKQLTLRNRNSSFFAFFRSQGVFTIFLILILYTIKTIFSFSSEGTLLYPLSNTVTFSEGGNQSVESTYIIPDQNSSIVIPQIDQDISYGGPLYVYPNLAISPDSIENPIINFNQTNWDTEVAIKVNLVESYSLPNEISNNAVLTVGLNYLCFVQDGKVNGVLLTLYPSDPNHFYVVNGLDQYNGSVFSLEWSNLIYLKVQSRQDPSKNWIGFLPMGCNNTLEITNGSTLNWTRDVNIPKLPYCEVGKVEMLCKIK